MASTYTRSIKRSSMVRSARPAPTAEFGDTADPGVELSVERSLSNLDQELEHPASWGSRSKARGDEDKIRWCTLDPSAVEPERGAKSPSTGMKWRIGK